MKNTKLISLWLAAMLTLSLFTACANPPGKTVSTDTVPQPADKLTTEDMTVPMDPVDLSVLSEEELDRITEDAQSKLRSMDKNEEASFIVAIKEDLSVSELDELVPH